VDLSTSTGFAYHPADAGMFFQWGSNVGWNATISPWGNGWNTANAPLQHWNPDTRQWVTGGWRTTPTLPPYTTWPVENDPCRHIRPIGAWRMPTSEQLQDLAAAAGRQWATTFAIATELGFGCWRGVLVGTAAAAGGNPVFLPATSFRNDTDGEWHNNAWLRSYHWATSRSGNNGGVLRTLGTTAQGITFQGNQYHVNRGFNVRCVRVD
jgi:hypothetical protein